MRIGKALTLGLLIVLVACAAAFLIRDSRPPENFKPETPAAAGTKIDPRAAAEGLRAAVRGRDFEAANRLEDELARAGEEAVPLLAEMLKDSESNEKADIECAQRAAFALGEIGGEQAVGALLQTLDASESDELRGQVLLALSKTKGDRAREVIAAFQAILADSDDDPKVRNSACFALARRAEPEAAAFLIGLNQKSSEADLQNWIVQALAFTPHRDAARTELLRVLNSNAAETLRGEAALSLVRLLKADSIEILKPLLEREALASVRRRALDGFGEIHSDAAVQRVLLQTLQTDADSGVRALAAAYLAVSGAGALVAPLEEALGKEADVYAQLKIIETLGAIGGEEAKAALARIEQKAATPRARSVAKEMREKIGGQKDAKAEKPF